MKLFRGSNKIRAIMILGFFVFWLIFLIVIFPAPLMDVASFLISAFCLMFFLNLGEGVTICENVKRDWYFAMLTIIMLGLSSVIYIYSRGVISSIGAGLIYAFAWESLDRYLFGICR